jgi:hypothetical protein
MARTLIDVAVAGHEDDREPVLRARSRPAARGRSSPGAARRAPRSPAGPRFGRNSRRVTLHRVTGGPQSLAGAPHIAVVLDDVHHREARPRLSWAEHPKGYSGEPGRAIGLWSQAGGVRHVVPEHLISGARPPPASGGTKRGRGPKTACAGWRHNPVPRLRVASRRPHRPSHDDEGVDRPGARRRSADRPSNCTSSRHRARGGGAARNSSADA